MGLGGRVFVSVEGGLCQYPPAMVRQPSHSPHTASTQPRRFNPTTWPPFSVEPNLIRRRSTAFRAERQLAVPRRAGWRADRKPHLSALTPRLCPPRTAAPGSHTDIPTLQCLPAGDICEIEHHCPVFFLIIWRGDLTIQLICFRLTHGKKHFLNCD